jgi:hypothetical protein
MIAGELLDIFFQYRDANADRGHTPLLGDSPAKGSVARLIQRQP